MFWCFIELIKHFFHFFISFLFNNYIDECYRRDGLIKILYVCYHYESYEWGYTYYHKSL